MNPINDKKILIDQKSTNSSVFFKEKGQAAVNEQSVKIESINQLGKKNVNQSTNSGLFETIRKSIATMPKPTKTTGGKNINTLLGSMTKVTDNLPQGKPDFLSTNGDRRLSSQLHKNNQSIIFKNKAIANLSPENQLRAEKSLYRPNTKINDSTSHLDNQQNKHIHSVKGLPIDQIDIFNRNKALTNKPTLVKQLATAPNTIDSLKEKNMRLFHYNSALFPIDSKNNDAQEHTNDVFNDGLTKFNSDLQEQEETKTTALELAEKLITSNDAKTKPTSEKADVLEDLYNKNNVTEQLLQSIFKAISEHRFTEEQTIRLLRRKFNKKRQEDEAALRILKVLHDEVNDFSGKHINIEALSDALKFIKENVLLNKNTESGLSSFSSSDYDSGSDAGTKLNNELDPQIVTANNTKAKAQQYFMDQKAFPQLFMKNGTLPGMIGQELNPMNSRQFLGLNKANVSSFLPADDNRFVSNQMITSARMPSTVNFPRADMSDDDRSTLNTHSRVVPFMNNLNEEKNNNITNIKTGLDRISFLTKNLPKLNITAANNDSGSRASTQTSGPNTNVKQTATRLSTTTPQLMPTDLKRLSLHIAQANQRNQNLAKADTTNKESLPADSTNKKCTSSSNNKNSKTKGNNSNSSSSKSIDNKQSGSSDNSSDVDVVDLKNDKDTASSSSSGFLASLTLDSDELSNFTSDESDKRLSVTSIKSKDSKKNEPEDNGKISDNNKDDGQKSIDENNAIKKKNSHMSKKYLAHAERMLAKQRLKSIATINDLNNNINLLSEKYNHLNEENLRQSRLVDNLNHQQEIFSKEVNHLLSDADDLVNNLKERVEGLSSVRKDQLAVRDATNDIKTVYRYMGVMLTDSLYSAIESRRNEAMARFELNHNKALYNAFEFA